MGLPSCGTSYFLSTDCTEQEVPISCALCVHGESLVAVFGGVQREVLMY